MKKQTSNKNVVAPEQKVKSLGQIISEYLAEAGFCNYGSTETSEVFSKPIAEAIQHSLYIFVEDTIIRIYQGFKADSTIRGHQLATCGVHDLEQVLGMLSEQNYL